MGQGISLIPVGQRRVDIVRTAVVIVYAAVQNAVKHVLGGHGQALVDPEGQLPAGDPNPFGFLGIRFNAG